MHKDNALLKQFKPRNFNLRVEFIPPGTTGHIQPLDRDLNRTFKEMVRNFSELYCTDTDSRIHRNPVHIRDNICLIQLLTYNHCFSPRFKGWIQRSFNICGYIDSHEPYLLLRPVFVFLLMCVGSNVINVRWKAMKQSWRKCAVAGVGIFLRFLFLFRWRLSLLQNIYSK